MPPLPSSCPLRRESSHFKKKPGPPPQGPLARGPFQKGRGGDEENTARTSAGVTKKSAIRTSRLLSKHIPGQITPFGVRLLYQGQLRCPAPFLDLLLTSDGEWHRLMELGIDEIVDSVSLREPGHCLGFVFPKPTGNVIGHADVKRAVPAAGKYVDAGLPHSGHSAMAGERKRGRFNSLVIPVPPAERPACFFSSFPRKRESSTFKKELDPRLRGGDEEKYCASFRGGGEEKEIASTTASFPRLRPNGRLAFFRHSRGSGNPAPSKKPGPPPQGPLARGPFQKGARG
jgi:hypothetical protein